MGCPGCYQENLTEHNNLIFDLEKKKELINLFKKIKEYNGYVKISFFGGEPLQRYKTILEIIDFIHEEKLKDSDLPDIHFISIPTSGGKNLNYFTCSQNQQNRIVQIKNKVLTLLPGTMLSVSLSYDGPNNLEARNIEPNQIEEAYKFLISHNLRPNLTSCVIPQIINEEYFVETYKDVVKRTGVAPSFTIPHLIHGYSNLVSKTFINSFNLLLDYLDLSMMKHPIDGKILGIISKQGYPLPKIVSDTTEKILKPILGTDEYNWCQAGVKHFTIEPQSSKFEQPAAKNTCEFISVPSDILHKKLMEKCKICEIKKYCQKPCLKNVEKLEATPKYLDNQCTIRKLIFQAIKNKIQKGK